jgi:hypothetical protein
MDGDSRPDLIASTEVGSYVFFRRTAMDMAKPPVVQFGEVSGTSVHHSIR